jgi:hypothetical protein
MARYIRAHAARTGMSEHTPITVRRSQARSRRACYPRRVAGYLVKGIALAVVGILFATAARAMPVSPS